MEYDEHPFAVVAAKAGVRPRLGIPRIPWRAFTGYRARCTEQTQQRGKRRFEKQRDHYSRGSS